VGVKRAILPAATSEWYVYPSEASCEGGFEGALPEYRSLRASRLNRDLMTLYHQWDKLRLSLAEALAKAGENRIWLTFFPGFFYWK